MDQLLAKAIRHPHTLHSVITATPHQHRQRIYLSHLLLCASLLTQPALAAEFKASPTGLGLQTALQQAQCGDTIYLQAGIYYENIETVRHCSADRPVTISGPRNAVIAGHQGHRIFQVKHDHHHLIGFAINGLEGDSGSKTSYKDKLLYAVGTPDYYVDGLKIIGMTFENAGGECIRLKYTHNAEIADSDIRNCGVYDFQFNDGGKNGEGIYIGTSSTQWDGKGPDLSSTNWIHDNSFNTNGNECVEVKEGGEGNIIEYNRCIGQLDDASAGIGLRGSANIVRYNRIYGNIGAGVRLGGHTVDGKIYGIDNKIYANEIFANEYAGVKIMEAPQIICDNEVYANPGGATRGNHSSSYDPSAPCDGPANPDEPAPAPSPSPAPQPAPTPDPEDNPPSQPGPIVVLPVNGVIASADDGNVPANTLDDSLLTRWSAKGNGQWIEYDLGSIKVVSKIAIAFYKGTERSAHFSIELSADGLSWTPRLESVQSADNTDQLQAFSFDAISARHVRIIGYGNSTGNGWNSFTEVEISGY